MNIQIGELARRTGCPVVTIRYYESEGLLLPPKRSESNYRLYDDSHVERLQFIRHCRSLDMALAEVKTLLNYRDKPTQDCGEVNTLLDKHIHHVESRVEAMLQLKQNLILLREKCSESRTVEECGILQGLSDCSYHFQSQ